MAEDQVPARMENSRSVLKPYTDGPGSRLPIDKVLDIIGQYDAGHLLSHIAQSVGSDRRTVGAVLRRYRDRPKAAAALLTQAAPMAAAAWLSSLSKASASGNHGPMKDLLLHVGAIQPAYGPGAAKPTQVAVQVVLGTPHAPIDHDPLNPKPVK